MAVAISIKYSVCQNRHLTSYSRWCIVSTWMKISSYFFLGLVAPSFEFFDSQHRYPIPRGTPSAGAQNIGVGTFCDFQQKSPFVSETIRDRPMIAMER